MRLAPLGKLLFFITSLYPLLLLLLFNESNFNIPIVSTVPILTYTVLLAIIITTIGFFFPYMVISRVDLPAKEYQVANVSDSTSESLNYLIAIIIGLTLGGTNPFIKINIWVILVLFYLLYDTGGLFYIQPTLILMGYKVLKCQSDEDQEVSIITRKHIKKDTKIKIFEITNNMVVYR